MLDRNTLAQFIRFGIVGVVSNGVLYLGYVALTAASLGPKLAMTLVYVAGTLQSFLFNKRWSFRSVNGYAPELVRYVLAYAFGYALNLAALFVLVDRLGLPHRVVQGFVIVALAFVLFALQKLWVFPPRLQTNSDAAL